MPAPDVANGDTPDEGAPGQVPDRQDDGLDLARALTRATAKATPAAKAKQRRRDQPPTARVSGSHPDDRDPQLLDATLGRLVDDHGWELDLRVHGVFAQWADIVGPDIAAHSEPESFADGRLRVRTSSTAWATELKLLAPSLVRRLNEDLGHGTVLVLEVLGPHGPTWKKGPRSVRGGRGPRDTYG